jgi:hypothetical protein
MEFKGSQAQQNPRLQGATNIASNQKGGGVPTPTSTMQMQQTSKNSNGMMMIIILVLIVLLGFGGFYMWMKKSSGLQGVDTSHYQAVFLTNGQVYFGKLSSSSSKYLTLTNIYYLQAPNQVQQSDKQAQTPPTQLSIVKLGSELHGPQDSMFISRDQVLFWENLKDDGKVVQAIKNPAQQTKQ